MALCIGLAILDDYLGEVGLTKEAVNELVDRLVIEFTWCTDLLNVTHVHYQHSVGDGHGFSLVMCNEYDRETKFLLQSLDLKSHGFA